MQASDVTLRLIRSNETLNDKVELGTQEDLVFALNNNMLKVNELAFA